ncbi:hypothetical protein [Novosphingobium sp.]|uniref:hypothetical protein n=1 Tax=Novosphingobium sp. TaxID=1874826 RepID=UPI003D0F2812
MPQRKVRFRPEPAADEQRRPRAARDHDGFIASPVHAMHQNLWAFAQSPAEPPLPLYPGWVRLAIPLVGSGALWVIIFWALGYLR